MAERWPWCNNRAYRSPITVGGRSRWADWAERGSRSDNGTDWSAVAVRGWVESGPGCHHGCPIGVSGHPAGSDSLAWDKSGRDWCIVARWVEGRPPVPCHYLSFLQVSSVSHFPLSFLLLLATSSFNILQTCRLDISMNDKLLQILCTNYL